MRLIEKGFFFLNSGDHKQALKVGRELKKLRHSSAFEILALAYLRQGKIAKAIHVLEDGVSKARRVWILWELLGNSYSDANRYEEAENAYLKALQQPGCDASLVHLNRGIAFHRQGKISEARAALRQVNSDHVKRRANALRIRLALADGKNSVARQLAAELERSRFPKGGYHERETESEIALSCSLAFQTSVDRKKKARTLAVRAVEHDPTNQAALSLIRELDAESDLHAKLYRLLILGRWPKPFAGESKIPGFYRTIHVVASNEKEAFWYAKQILPTELRRQLSVEECSLSNARMKQKGVYYLSGYAFFEES